MAKIDSWGNLVLNFLKCKKKNSVNTLKFFFNGMDLRIDLETVELSGIFRPNKNDLNCNLRTLSQKALHVWPQIFIIQNQW